jgi:hypothetical protein
MENQPGFQELRAHCAVESIHKWNFLIGRLTGLALENNPTPLHPKSVGAISTAQEHGQACRAGRSSSMLGGLRPLQLPSLIPAVFRASFQGSALSGTSTTCVGRSDF